MIKYVDDERLQDGAMHPNMLFGLARIYLLTHRESLFGGFTIFHYKIILTDSNNKLLRKLNPFYAWYLQIAHTYLNKPETFRCRFA